MSGMPLNIPVRLDDEIEVAPLPEMTTEQFNAWFDVDRDLPELRD